MSQLDGRGIWGGGIDLLAFMVRYMSAHAINGPTRSPVRIPSSEESLTRDQLSV